MKHVKLFILLIQSIIYSLSVFSQKGNNEFEEIRMNCETKNAFDADTLVDYLQNDEAAAFNTLKNILKNHNLSASNQVSLDSLSDRIYTTFNDIDKGENAAVILVYRNIKKLSGGNPYSADFNSLNTKVYHKRRSKNLSSYLWGTKKIFFIFIDLGNAFFQANNENDKKLSETTIRIEYEDSWLKQTAQATAQLFKMGGGNGPQTLGITLVEVKEQRVKSPCSIILSNKTFKEDQKFKVHEKNVASVQIGVENSKYSLNNFSISNGNLVVTPSNDQIDQWKSHLYASLEVHIPRDIDNFMPLWKVIFEKHVDKGQDNIGSRIYNLTLYRMGIYGGIKVAKDPLSNLYAGVNYALSKEMYVNFGYAWQNDIVPQITSIGQITSLEDALKYAKRSYSGNKFSVGLSFSPMRLKELLKNSPKQ